VSVIVGVCAGVSGGVIGVARNNAPDGTSPQRTRLSALAAIPTKKGRRIV